MKKILFLLFLVSNLASLAAQRSGIISGTISDSEMHEEPLLFANVALKNTLWSAQTNFHGNFEFSDVPAGDYTLVVTYLGYETLKMPIVVKAGETTSVQKGLSALTIDSGSVAISAAHEGHISTEISELKARKPND